MPSAFGNGNRLGRDCPFAAKPAITHTSATLVSTCISPPPMALYSDKTESGKYFRLVSLAFQIRPIAGLNETGPVVRILAVLALEHRQSPVAMLRPFQAAASTPYSRLPSSRRSRGRSQPTGSSP